MLSPEPKSRRKFLAQSLLFLLAFPLVARAAKPAAKAPAAPKKDVPLPAGATMASESDPVASAIGYKHDPKNLDPARAAQLKKAGGKQDCANCALYIPSNEGWGKCQMITNGLVAAGGWCGSWSKKS